MGLAVPVAVAQVTPASAENSYLAREYDPNDGAVKLTLSFVPSPLTAVAAGVVGAAGPVATASVEEAELVPLAFTVLSATLYAVFAVRPLMVMGEAVTTGLAAVHVVPPSVEYWKFVVAVPATVNAIVTLVAVDVLTESEVGAVGSVVPDALDPELELPVLSIVLTLTVYAVFAVRFDTTIGDAVVAGLGTTTVPALGAVIWYE